MLSSYIFIVVVYLLLCTTLINGALPWLKVRKVNKNLYVNSTRDYIIVDEYDREIQLKGINVELENRDRPPLQRPTNPKAYINKCPPNLQGYNIPPICQIHAAKGKYNVDTSDYGKDDIAQIRNVGFNFIRLAISWDMLNPTPNYINTQYIDRIEQIVNWCEEQELYVIIDMHEDLYSLVSSIYSLYVYIHVSYKYKTLTKKIYIYIIDITFIYIHILIYI